MTDIRVVITGAGVIAPNAIGRKEFWKALEEGRSGIDEISYFDHSIFPSHLAGEVRNFDASLYMDAKTAKRVDRSTQFAIAATAMALEDAKLELTREIQEEAPVYIGTAMSGHISYIEQLRIYFTKGYKKVSPFAAVACFPDACSGQLSIFFKLNGPAQTICAGCAAGTNAVIEAYKSIKTGSARTAIAGGTDAPLSEEIYCAFCQSKVLSQKTEKTPSPFDATRDGIVISEGAAILVVESLSHALERNAPVLGEIIGYGETTDAYNMAGPEPTGIQRARAVKIALRSAGITPEEVDYVNAHGTGTVSNDSNETNVIKEVFGEHAYKLLVNSTKSMIGHTQGAAGALEIIACLLALNESIVHPTINYSGKDPECDLNYVPNQAVRRETKIAVSNSFAFGGKNSIIVLKKYEE